MIRLALCLVVSLLVSPVTVSVDDELAPRAVRTALRGLARDLARLGLREEVALLRSSLLELGDDPGALEKLQGTWEKELTRASDSPKRRASARRKLAQQVDALAGVFAQAPEVAGVPGAKRDVLAEILLRFDSEHEAALEHQGRVLVGGDWLTPRDAKRRADATRIAELVQAARKLPFELERGLSSLPAVRSVYGDEAPTVALHGMTLHGGLAPEKLERILLQAMRCVALSNALRGGELALPIGLSRYDLVIARDETTFFAALDEALDSGGLTAEGVRVVREQKLGSFVDDRGWITTRWKTEARLSALVLWHLSWRFLGPEIQPCLEAGHLNWICISMLGCSMPSAAWSEESGEPARTTSAQVNVERRWFAARRSLRGCRSWLENRVRAGESFPWARAMLDHTGKISDTALLKTTMVCELLQERGTLDELILATSDRTDRAAAIAAGLGLELPAFEAEWRAWLLGDGAPAPGLMQRLRPNDGANRAANRTAKTPIDARARAMLERLDAIRSRAFRPLGFEVPRVELDPGLTAGAAAHAAYLELNPGQARRWPDAHEEYADRAGFTPEGAWAGANGVIVTTSDPAAALDGWMGTFYHRLPLLDPGLIGVGYGVAEDVTVLDVTSLVTDAACDVLVTWPPAGATGIERRWQPELPNPVPGADQSGWGYPITVQVFRTDATAEIELDLRLFRGESAQGEPVTCYSLSPQTALLLELVPPNAFCLIPEERLLAQTTYTVQARSRAGVQIWSFTTGR